MSRAKKEDVRLYCSCGAAAVGTVSPKAVADRIRADWKGVHRGPGHAPATAKQAAAARRREHMKDVDG